MENENKTLGITILEVNLLWNANINQHPSRSDKSA